MLSRSGLDRWRHARRAATFSGIAWVDRSPYLLTVSPIVAIEFENIITSIPFGPLRNVSRPRKVSPLPKSVINRLPNHHVLTLDRTLLRDCTPPLSLRKTAWRSPVRFRIVTSASPREVSHPCAIDPERGVASRAGAREDKPVFDPWPPHSAPVLPPTPTQ